MLAWIGLVLLLVALDRTTAALMALLLGMALPLVFTRSAPPEDNLLALLLALGAGVVAGTELVFLRDFLAGGDWYRMNTLFKFSVPAWLLLGIACGVMLPRLWHELSRLAGLGGRALAVGVWFSRCWPACCSCRWAFQHGSRIAFRARGRPIGTLERHGLHDRGQTGLARCPT